MVPAFKKSGMGQGSVALLLFRFSFPAALGLVSNALYNIVDRLFIGRFVGNSGLGAVGLTFPLTVFIAAVGSLVGIGSSSQMSRFLGEGRTVRAERVLGTAVTTMAVLSVAFATCGLLNLDVLTGALGAGSELFYDTKSYLKIILLGMPFALMSFSLNCLIRAEGQARDAMLTLVIGAAVNIFLDWLLVARLGMGIHGAAVGTAVAQAAAFAWTAVFYFTKSTLISGSFSLRPDIGILGDMLRIGFSPFCVKIFYTLCMMFFNGIVGGLGGPLAVSAMGIFFCLDELIYIPIFGISDGLAPIVGYNYGAGQSDRVKRAVVWALGAGTVYFMVSFVCAESFAPAMVSMFTDDADLIGMTSRAMRIGYMGMPFAASGIIASSVFLALGRAGISLFLNMCRQGLIFFLALMLLPGLIGLDGAWGSFAVVDLGGGLIGGVSLAYFWDSLGGEAGAKQAAGTKRVYLHAVSN